MDVAHLLHFIHCTTKGKEGHNANRWSPPLLTQARAESLVVLGRNDKENIYTRPAEAEEKVGGGTREKGKVKGRREKGNAVRETYEHLC